MISALQNTSATSSCFWLVTSYSELTEMHNYNCWSVYPFSCLALKSTETSVRKEQGK